MLTLFGNLDSGNTHKVQMILKLQILKFRRVDVRQDLGQPRDTKFLKICPIGKIPAVMLENGDVLSESGALLYYFVRKKRHTGRQTRVRKLKFCGGCSLSSIAMSQPLLYCVISHAFPRLTKYQLHRSKIWRSNRDLLWMR